ncbi:DUF2523 family protein [Thaumasiovibrio subtropicus]|uniref:DUF2523 family protein n=1 Tax=Thaumasiovibrio subtropicus TaxID=1891207 RepID=UPI000B35567F|nr:DUF2523 family protein [Thaumasiovibrio subtropicus]
MLPAIPLLATAAGWIIRIFAWLLPTITVWLGPVVMGFIARAFLSMGGFGVVFSGMNLLFSQVIAHLVSMMGAIPEITFKLVVLMGIPDALNIYLGALSALATWKGTTKLGSAVNTMTGKPKLSGGYFFTGKP